MFWILIVIIAHFINALVFIIDKYLLKRPIPNPLVYAFYASILSLGVLVLIPFGFSFEDLNTKIIITSFAAGAAFLPFLIYFYKAVKLKDVSSIVPLVGSASAIFTLLLARLILNEILTPRTYLAFALLVFGGILITLPLLPKRRRVKTKKSGTSSKQSAKWKKNAVLLALLASTFFALSLVLSKLVFNQTEFISGFVTIRFGNFLAALLLLIPLKLRKTLLKAPRKTGSKTSMVFVSNKVMAGFAFVLLNFAIALSTPTLVNAMQGLQYAFLFVLAIIFHHRFSKIYEEKLTFRHIFQKSISIALIVTGLALIAL